MIKIENFFWGKTRGKFGGKSLRAMGENLGAKKIGVMLGVDFGEKHLG